MSTGAKASLSRAEQLEEILSSSQRTRASTEQKEAAKESDSRFASIDANPFFQIVFNAETNPDEKQQELAKILTFSGTKEEARENIAAYNLFKEYLQSVREEMAVDTIKMSDPKNFAVLRDTYESMNGGLIDFENKIEPLTKLLEALEQLGRDGQTMDAFREIKDDETRNAAIAARNAEINGMIEDINRQLRQYEEQSAVLEEDKNWLGQVKKSAREEQARISVRRQEALVKLDEISEQARNAQIENQNAVNETTVKNTEAKRLLKEMISTSAEGHANQGQAVIDSAVEFVANSKEKIGVIREHLTAMEQQITNLHDSSDNMTMVFALLDGGTKIAEEENKKIREGLINPPEDENTVQRLTREGRKRDLDEHISVLENSAQDTTATIADLTSQSIRIKDMKDSNQGQIQMAREMHARGVAGVADRISTVIQAVGQAALSESSRMAANTLEKMQENTDAIAQKSSIQVAMSIKDRNENLEKAIANLAQYGKVHAAATQITRDGLSDMSRLINEMENTSKEVAANVSKSYALAADNVSGFTPEEVKTGGAAAKPGSNIKSPFAR